MHWARTPSLPSSAGLDTARLGVARRGCAADFFNSQIASRAAHRPTHVALPHRVAGGRGTSRLRRVRAGCQRQKPCRRHCDQRDTMSRTPGRPHAGTEEQSAAILASRGRRNRVARTLAPEEDTPGNSRPVPSRDCIAVPRQASASPDAAHVERGHDLNAIGLGAIEEADRHGLAAVVVRSRCPERRGVKRSHSQVRRVNPQDVRLDVDNRVEPSPRGAASPRRSLREGQPACAAAGRTRPLNRFSSRRGVRVAASSRNDSTVLRRCSLEHSRKISCVLRRPERSGPASPATRLRPDAQRA